MLASNAAPTSTSKAPRPIARGTRVCVYQVQGDADGSRIGQLTSSKTLTPEQVDQINGLLQRVTSGRGCSITEHTRFALLDGTDGTTLVALDGCALLQDSTVWTSTDQLRAQVG